MKLDIKKHTYTVYNNYSGLPFEMQLLKAIKKGQNRLRDFSSRIQQGEKRKRCHPKSDFQLWQAAHFSTKNSINKPAMNKRRLLIAAVFHFMHPVEKYSKKITSWQKTRYNCVSVRYNCATCDMRFPAKKSLLFPTPRFHADYFPLPGKSVRTDVRWRHNQNVLDG